MNTSPAFHEAQASHEAQTSHEAPPAAREAPALIYRRKITARPTYKNVTMVDARIQYPQAVVPGNAASSAAISRYYRETAEKYHSYVTGELYRSAVEEFQASKQQNFPFRTYAATMDYAVPFNRAGLLSITCDLYEFTGGAHGNTVRTAETFRTADATPVRLQAFFTSPAYQTDVFHEIIRQIEERSAKEGAVFFDEYKRNVFKYFDSRNFYLSDEGVVIFYPLYTIAPYVAGIVTFTLPWDMPGMRSLPAAQPTPAAPARPARRRR